MPCVICGETRTVRSHIVPKALMIETRRQEPHLVTGSRFHNGAKPSQGGHFSDRILCAAHETLTGPFDKYGTEFIRRAEAIFQATKPDRSFTVSNPKPQTLHRFALATIWREVQNNGANHKVTLGKYAAAVQDAVFAGAAINWPMLVSRTRFTLDSPDTVRMVVHPYRVRIGERNAWTFTAAGYAFYLFSDARGVGILPDWLRANVSDPACVVVNHSLDLRSVASFKPIFQNMSR